MNKKQEIKNRIDLINKSEIPEGYKCCWGYFYPADWSIKKIKDLFNKVKTKNTDSSTLPVFTNSATQGVILQDEYFDREIVNEDNTSGYYIVENGDFMYNPRISSNAPAGPINRNHLDIKGIASPLYTVFRAKKDENIEFIENYFKSNYWHRYMKSVSNQGARHDRLNLTDDDFMNMPIPQPPGKEQKKIAEILSCCNKVIKLKEQLLNEQNKQKEWIRQNILTGKQRLKGFNKAWEKLALKNIFTECKKTSTGIEEEHYVAVKKGIVNQLEHLGKRCAAEDSSNYNLVEPGDVVYTKSPTGKFPYGIIKQSKLTYNAIVSPLYGVFKPKTFELGAFLDEYFSSSVNTNNYLKPIIQKGAKNTINITNATFLSNYVKIPTDIMEQKAIYNLIDINNKKISALEQELEQYKQLKKALSQLLLTGIVRTME